jgi:hypothetical protein
VVLQSEQDHRVIADAALSPLMNLIFPIDFAGLPTGCKATFMTTLLLVYVAAGASVRLRPCQAVQEAAAIIVFVVSGRPSGVGGFLSEPVVAGSPVVGTSTHHCSCTF